MTFAAQILTLYPEMFPGPLGVSLAGRALGEGAWSLEAVQIRDFATDKHRTVDDTPAGGGAGMVLRADVVGQSATVPMRRERCFSLSIRAARVSPQYEDRFRARHPNVRCTIEVAPGVSFRNPQAFSNIGK